jgi:hypothetical protein
MACMLVTFKMKLKYISDYKTKKQTMPWVEQTNFKYGGNELQSQLQVSLQQTVSS